MTMLRILIYSCLIVVGFFVFIVMGSEPICSYSVDVLIQKASGKIYTKKEVCHDKDGESYGTTIAYFDRGTALPISLFSYSSFKEKKFHLTWDENKKIITVKTLNGFDFWGRTTYFDDYRVRYVSE